MRNLIVYLLFMYMNTQQDYCIIRTISKLDIILMLYYNQSYSNYPTCFTTNSANSTFRLICLCDCFNNLSISHILYLSKELYKAELTVYMKQKYVQD